MKKWMGVVFAVVILTGFASMASAQECVCPGQGDLNDDGVIDAVDVAMIIDYAFRGGPVPMSDPTCPTNHRGDWTCDNWCNLVDVVHAIDHVFNGGEPPCNPCGSPNPECAGANCATFVPCNEPNDCSAPVCATLYEGGGLCLEGTTPCAGLIPCPSGTGDCPPGYVCAIESCCGEPVCVPPEAFCEELPPGREAPPHEAPPTGIQTIGGHGN